MRVWKFGLTGAGTKKLKRNERNNTEQHDFDKTRYAIWV